MNNVFVFEDDDNIRKAIIDKMNEEKNTEKNLLSKLEEISYWYEIENKVLIEKEKILKKLKEELFIQRKQKMKELHSIYGIGRVDTIIRKYKINI